MTEIKVNENGQAFFDFDALEKITSKEFVQSILSKVGSDISSVFVDENEYDVRVYVKNLTNAYVDIFNYSKSISHVFSSKRVWNFEVDLLGKIFNDGDFNGKN
jgi:hypothetical protein